MLVSCRMGQSKRRLTGVSKRDGGPRFILAGRRVLAHPSGLSRRGPAGRETHAVNDENPYQSSISSAEDAPPVARMRVETVLGRLRLWHVGVLFVSVVAVVTVRLSWVDWIQSQGSFTGYGRLPNLLLAIVLGSSVAAAVIFGASSWRRGWRLPTQPGHGYLLCLAAVALLEGVVAALYYTNNAIYPVLSHYNAWHMQKLALCGVAGMVALLTSANLQGSRLWRLALQVPAVVLLGLCPMHLVALGGVYHASFFAAHPYSQLVAAVAVILLLAAAGARDRNRTQTTDWVNRLGIGVMATLCVLLVADALYWLRMDA